MWSLKLILIALLCSLVDSSRILLLMHLQRSHSAEVIKIGQALLEKGHEVYTIFPDCSKQVNQTSEKGIHVLTFRTSTGEVYMDSEAFDDLLSTEIMDEKMVPGIPLVFDVTKRHCQKILENEQLVQKVKDLHFDLALVDAFKLNYCHFILPHILSIPHVSLSSAVIPYWQMGIPGLPSFVVGEVLETHGDKLSFWKRLENLVYHIIMNGNVFAEVFDKDLLNQYAPDVRNWNDLLRETQLYILFRDEILERPVPSMPNTVFLPGLSYKPANDLTENIQHIVSQANKGVFVMSFGSAAGFLSLDIMVKFLQVFSCFPDYQVLWKFPLQKLEHKHELQLPPNVHLLEWLPQNDILGHEKTKLFITHCGNNGQYEAVYHVVPMIGFPLFAEQHHNADRMIYHGYGVKLNLHRFTTSELLQGITDILINDSYQQTVGMASAMLKDRRHPTDEAVERIEHIMKYGGKHLRGDSMDMPWHQLLMIDVMTFLFAVTACFIALAAYSLCLLIRLCNKQKKQKLS